MSDNTFCDISYENEGNFLEIYLEPTRPYEHTVQLVSQDNSFLGVPFEELKKYYGGACRIADGKISRVEANDTSTAE